MTMHPLIQAILEYERAKMALRFLLPGTPIEALDKLSEAIAAMDFKVSEKEAEPPVKASKRPKAGTSVYIAAPTEEITFEEAAYRILRSEGTPLPMGQILHELARRKWVFGKTVANVHSYARGILKASKRIFSEKSNGMYAYHLGEGAPDIKGPLKSAIFIKTESGNVSFEIAALRVLKKEGPLTTRELLASFDRKGWQFSRVIRDRSAYCRATFRRISGVKRRLEPVPGSKNTVYRYSLK